MDEPLKKLNFPKENLNGRELAIIKTDMNSDSYVVKCSHYWRSEWHDLLNS